MRLILAAALHAPALERVSIRSTQALAWVCCNPRRSGLRYANKKMVTLLPELVSVLRDTMRDDRDGQAT
jgi:hypothetical protein